MSIEQWVLLVASAVGGVWALVRFVIPKIVDAKIEAGRDEREHLQELELKRANYDTLQNSWQQDKMATLLEENESFIRERVWQKLEEVAAAVKKLEMTTAQARDTMAIVTRELYELHKAIRGEKTDDD